MTEKLRVLLTGAAGRVGTALWRGWERDERYELTLTDRQPIEGAQSRCEVAELGDYKRLCQLCQGQDALVHLAYIPPRTFGKEPGEVTDIGAAMLLFEAAREAGIKKIVYASSNHASGWNEKLRSPPRFSSGDQFRPDGWYGAMKGMAEIAGRYLVDAFDMHFISIRIGTFTGGSEPRSVRLCSTLLTPRDAVQLFGLAVDYQGPVKYLITYGTSGNWDDYQMGFLDLSGAMEVLGYRPEDNLYKQYRHKFD